MSNLNSESKERYMRQALDLAQKGRGRTSPNPMVGAVVVKNGKVVGEGYHKKAGLPHAEVVALRRAGNRARGGQLFVNLEPCCHFGRTPPCTRAIVDSGIKAVYIGMRDPNKLVGGKGIRILREAGIKVETGILRTECERLNEVFCKYIRTGMPFVILKSALSLDGKIATATGMSRWITGTQSRRRVHEIRGEVDAILVGTGTVVKDNPFLTARLKNKRGKNPTRVILDGKGKVPLDANVFRNSETQRVIYATTKAVAGERETLLRQAGAEICVVGERDGVLDLPQLMRFLGERELTSVLMEGGAEVNASALQSDIVDKVMFFIAPIIIGGRDAPCAVGGRGIEDLKEALKIKNLSVRGFGRDLLLEGYL